MTVVVRTSEFILELMEEAKEKEGGHLLLFFDLSHAEEYARRHEDGDGYLDPYFFLWLEELLDFYKEETGFTGLDYINRIYEHADLNWRAQSLPEG